MVTIGKLSKHLTIDIYTMSVKLLYHLVVLHIKRKIVVMKRRVLGANLRHEVNTLKQMVDSLVVEVWNMKMGKVCQCRK